MIAIFHLRQSAICYNYFTWRLFILCMDTPRSPLPLIVYLNGYLLFSFWGCDFLALWQTAGYKSTKQKSFFHKIPVTAQSLLALHLNS